MHVSNMNEKRDKNREDKTAPKYDGRESLLYEGEHHQRQRHLGESKVNMTLSLVKWGESEGARVESGDQEIKRSNG